MIGIKFCGGCHPGYERSEALKKIKASHPDKEICLVKKDGAYSYVVLLCGCPAQCASWEGYDAAEGYIWLDHMPDEEELNNMFK